MSARATSQPLLLWSSAHAATATRRGHRAREIRSGRWLTRIASTGIARALWLFAIALSAVVLAACGNHRIAWTEEVRLSSGEVIDVKRSVTSQQLGEIGGSGGWEAESMSLKM